MTNPVFITSACLLLVCIFCSYEAININNTKTEKESYTESIRDYKQVRKSGHQTQKNSPHFDLMVQDSPALQFIAQGATIGSVLGPVGTVVGAIIGGILCLFICPRNSQPNQPPKFNFCPESGKILYADEGKTTARYEWKTPTVVDPEDGELSAELQGDGSSGSSFPRGKHYIIYKATDKKGLMASCVFSFTVIVTSCDPPEWPSNGDINCDKSEILAGTICRVRCSPGYKLDPDISTMKCVKKGTRASMNVPTPNCKEISCPIDVPKMKPEHGMPVCTHPNHKYDSACSTKCEQGYSPTNLMFSVCQKNGLWSQKLPDCKDSDPPNIEDCPNTIRTYTNRNSRTSIVSWRELKATDNSNMVMLKQTRGRTNGTAFDVGFEEIRYHAVDAAGNKSPECIFFVVVEELRCTPPVITDKYMTYQCPHGFPYGSQCSLRCMGRFPLIGNDTIVCEIKENSTKSPPPTHWHKGDIEPHCKLNPCKDLPAPVNGAMSCDTWMFGRQCQMQCSDKFDIPAVGDGFSGIFTCSEREGIFKPLNTVPNCTEKRLPGHVETLGEFFYYTGSCDDATVLDKIKSNFINQMEILETKGFAGVCSDSLECNVKNVSVTCGPRTRKRRSLEYSVRSKRSGSEIRVEIKISSKWPLSNVSTIDSLNMAKKIQQNIFDKIQDISKEGKLTVEGISPDDESFVLGYSASVCDVALYLRQDILTCVPCARGSFLTKTRRGRQVCTPCPKGFYKEDEYEPQCTQCPQNTSTVESGSMFFTDCIDTCKPGEYSETGLFPCTPCEKSTYQNASSSRSCIQCPRDMTTAFEGSIDALNCSNFDLLFTQNGDRIDTKYRTMAEAISGITVITWMRYSDPKADMALFHSKGLRVIMAETISIEKGTVRNWISTGVSISNGTWEHITVVFQKRHPVVSIYINKKLKYTSQSSLFMTDSELMLSTTDITLKLNSDIETGVVISGYQIILQPLSVEQILSSAKTCHAKFTDSYISMTDLSTAASKGVEMIVPSQCDSVNECESNPCNGHQCINRVKGYVCQCNNGYSGKNCEVKPDYCKHEPCQNGATCVTMENGNYTCSCKKGFKGIRCENNIVNGGWSAWSPFTECSVSCNGGTKTRTRICNSPLPDPNGVPCNASEATDHVTCHEEKCPVCPSLKRTFGSVRQCKPASDGHTVCVVTCRPGYTFLPGNLPLPEYLCGKNTSYVWNGEPPACGKLEIPSQISTETVVSYGKPLPCDKAAKASERLKAQMESTLQCARNKTCKVTVEAKECSQGHRNKRAVTVQSQQITLTTITAEKIDIQSIAETMKTNEAAKRYLIGLAELELSAQQLNSSNDELIIKMDGDTFTPTGKATSSVVKCPEGQGRYMYLCADCPSGTHSSAGECILCLKGTYQEENGQSTCKQCPKGQTTKYEGSQSPSDCIETSIKKYSPSSETDYESKTQIIVLAVSVMVSLGFVMITGIVVYKKCIRSQHCYNGWRTRHQGSFHMIATNEKQT
uniref:Sushi, von Willebrand factor type A, EGF and pentraxin domain-containing protein 1-like isoform X2 n=1 Tax=Crassostrea virginica TaxID=6565 RepID=A0A8B8AB46_CRAVI|nr:sushi, von Willebrand factor type A, EGF and pentraxin domain-containing protein 1-like isoform X2 [Crassostrea virginica]